MPSQTTHNANGTMSPNATTTTTLITVNTNPARATRLISLAIAQLSPAYKLQHLANAATQSEALPLFQKHKPDLVFTASMWTASESAAILAQARSVNPAVKTLALPEGLQVEQGPDAVVAWIVERVPGLLGGGSAEECL